MSLLELAAKVEQLDGPDRRIDTEILEMVGSFTPTGLPTFRGGLGYPAFTQSLDAAMSLKPADTADEATFWKVGNDGEGGDPSLFKATVLIVSAFTSKPFWAVADTAPLALCAAALRARAAISLAGEGHD